MAQVKFEKIISCSSEDPDFPAKNILTCGEVPGAWKTANEGESQGTVVIQLDRKYKISQLEIKNEASAFIEVLVANQDENEEATFQVLLSVSSFMTPNESKNLSNINRLRVFAKDKLSPSALKQSFDLVKLNCTQPFNKTIKYGISHLKIMEGDAGESSSPISSALSIKNRVSDSKEDKTLASPTKDISPRAGTTPVDKLNIPNQKDDDSPSPNKKVKVATKTSDKPSTSKEQDKRNAKPKEKKTKVDQPFCQLMKGVTFTISGFQNPLRSEIRSKGLQMGAKYKGDWDRSCTHLICAFPNTPKFNQVNGTGGKIVTKEWIEESYDQRKLLPWKKYSLVDGGRTSKKDESDSEDEDDGEMDDFIVDDEDEDEEYDPKTKDEIEDEDEDINELGPVLPRKLRDDSPQRPRQPTSINSPTQNKSPQDKKVDSVKVKAKNKIKDEDYNSDDIYDAATDED